MLYGVTSGAIVSRCTVGVSEILINCEYRYVGAGG